MATELGLVVGGTILAATIRMTDQGRPRGANGQGLTKRDAVIYLRDVAYVHRGGPPQQNIVLVKGQQSILLEILKNGDASTLSVVSGVRAKLPELLKTLPPGVTITPLNDASNFVRASIDDVVQEMVTAAFLAGITVLLFVGSWRSTLIVATSIPLSILSSILVLSWIGQTINVMTLGGLALAVGILVDDATVMIENINTHLEEAGADGSHKGLADSIVDAANQIVVPTFVSTLCICIVWLPLLQLGGVAGYLFLPLAEAIIFAMIASFILSRTLTPTMAAWLLRGQVAARDNPALAGRPGIFTRFQAGFERRFERFRDGYRDMLVGLAARRKRFVVMYFGGALASLLLLLFVGQDFFPRIKSGQLALHMRAPIGTRIEETSKIATLVDQQVRELLPGHVVGTLLNCGLPASGINQAYSNTGTVGTQDCDLTISLDNQASPVDRYRQILRVGLAERFPGTEFSFLPGDVTAQILNFGLPSPIDVQVSGRELQGNFAYATKLAARLKQIAGIADVRIQQVMGQPTLLLASRRAFALGTGLTESDIADNALANLSGSGQVAPTYWLDTSSGVSHLVNVQTPQNHLTSINDLENITVDKGDGNPGNVQPQLVGGLSAIGQTGTPGLVSHSEITPVIDIYANVEGRDLGAVSNAVGRVIKDMSPDLPYGASVAVTGQATTMHSAYFQLLTGLALSIVLIYLVIVVNFQSWLDPFIIITALPAALGGISWSLFLTNTTLSVPALTGAIMCMGTATANTILVVAFARERLAEHGDSVMAAIEAGHARIRPVLMTALAMIVGMFPMSFSNTQNAAGPCGDRRVDRRHGHDPGVRAVRLRHSAWRQVQGSQGGTAGSLRMTGTTDVKPAGRRGILFVVIGVLVAGGLAAYGIRARSDSVAALQQSVDNAAVPRVQVVSPKPGPAQRELTLPGTINAWFDAPIYAQVSGYVSHWYKDYGATVKSGDVLATIETPALDAQFEASKANLAVVQARYKLAEITAKRWAALAGTEAVAQQDMDVKAADAAAQKASVAAAQQDVARYQALIVFKKLVAPFNGVVTARRTDVGDYVNAAGGDPTLKSSATPLFSVADIHEMRVFVSVPQEYAGVLKPDLAATLTLPVAPDKPITAKFLTTANAVETPTRTVVTELSVDNAKGELWPGTYVNVHFTFPSDPNILILPEQALLFRAQGMQVAVLDAQDRVHLQDVVLGRNLDTNVQIISGLKATDRVVGSPSLGLLEGQQVKVVEPVTGYSATPPSRSPPVSASGSPPQASSESLPAPAPAPPAAELARNSGTVPAAGAHQ
jgi:RND family efflux transporter MFP subunit